MGIRKVVAMLSIFGVAVVTPVSPATATPSAGSPTIVEWESGEEVTPPELPLALEIERIHGGIKKPANDRGDITVQSMSGCNGSVCMSLTGSSLRVEWIKGDAPTNSYRCVTGDIDVNLTTIKRTPVLCGRAGSVFYLSWNVDDYFYHGDKICVAFRGASGYASITGYPWCTVKL